MRISDWSSDVCSTDLVQSVSRPCVVPFVVVGEGAVSRSACGLAGACRSTSEEGSSTWPSHHPSAHRRSWRRCCLQLQDRKSTRLTPVTNAHLVCRLLLEKKKNTL